MEVTLVDDGRVKLLFVLHDRVVYILGDHGAVSVVLRINIVKEVFDDLTERLSRLFMEVRNSNASCKNGIVRMSRCLVCCSLGGEVV